MFAQNGSTAAYRQSTSVPLDLVYSKLTNPKKNGDGWMACCPAHDDKRASLSVGPGKDGKVLLSCFAGCPVEAIVSGLGLEMSDLFDHRNEPVKPTIVTTYNYVDTAGKLIYKVHRKSDKTFMHQQANGDWHMKGIERLLYGLPEVIAAVAEGNTIYIPEGEKDVDNLRRIGLVATTKSGGARAPWLASHSAPLRGADVVILPDHDVPGRGQAHQILTALRGTAKSIRVLELPGLQEKGDVSDWIAAGGTREQLEGLAAAAPSEWAPPATDTAHAAPEIGLAIEVESAPRPRRYLVEDEIDALRPPTWLVKNIIPAGEVSVVVGPGDSGKTFMVLDLAKRVSLHYPIMYVAAEDAAGIKIRKRAWELHSKTGKTGNFNMWPEAIHLIDPMEVGMFVDDVRPLGLKLIVVDTLSQSIAGADENSSKDMALVMEHCQRIARETGAAVILIHHTTKGGDAYRGSSTIKYNTYAFLEVSKDDDVIRLECGRVKNTRPFTPRFFKLVSVTTDLQDEAGALIESAVIMPSERVLQGAGITQNQMRMLEALANISDATGGARSTDLVQATGLNGNSFYSALKRLRELGYADKDDAHTAPIVITDSGRKRLDQELKQPTSGANSATGELDITFEINPNLGPNILPSGDGRIITPEGGISDPEVSNTPVNPTADLGHHKANLPNPTIDLPYTNGRTPLILPTTPPPLRGEDGRNGREDHPENGSATIIVSDYDRRRIDEIDFYLSRQEITRAETTRRMLRSAVAQQMADDMLRAHQDMQAAADGAQAADELPE